MTESLKEKTAKGLFWGGISNTLQQLLGAIFGIFLGRLLSPADYGMIGLLAIFTAVANSMQESGFTSALTNRKEFRHEDYNAVFWFSLGIGTFLYILLFFCAPLIADFYDTPQLTPLARYLFLGFLISSSGTAHNAILFRRMMVKQKAKAMLTAITLSGTIGVLMAFNGMAYWGMATQSILYILTSNLMVWYYSPWRPTWSFSFQPIREMLPFSSKMLAMNIFRFINENIFSNILGRYYPKQDVGYYTQAYKWTNMGQASITGIINGITQPVMVEIDNNPERQRKVFRKILRFTAFLSFPAMLGLALIAPEFITITVTDKWASSVPIMRYLCTWGAFIPINYIYIHFLTSKNKSNILMWNTIAQSVVIISALLFTIPYGVLTMAAAYTTINILWLPIFHYFTWKQIRIKPIDVIKDIAPYILITLGTLATVHYITAGIGNIYLRLAAKVCLAVALYATILWKSNSVIFKESLNYLFKKKNQQ